MLTLAICAFIVITLTIWVSFRVSVLVFFQLGSPLYGIVSCLIPFFLIYKKVRRARVNEAGVVLTKKTWWGEGGEGGGWEGGRGGGGGGGGREGREGGVKNVRFLGRWGEGRKKKLRKGREGGGREK